MTSLLLFGAAGATMVVHLLGDASPLTLPDLLFIGLAVVLGLVMGLDRFGRTGAAPDAYEGKTDVAPHPPGALTGRKRTWLGIGLFLCGVVAVGTVVYLRRSIAASDRGIYVDIAVVVLVVLLLALAVTAWRRPRSADPLSGPIGRHLAIWLVIGVLVVGIYYAAGDLLRPAPPTAVLLMNENGLYEIDAFIAGEPVTLVLDPAVHELTLTVADAERLHLDPTGTWVINAGKSMQWFGIVGPIQLGAIEISGAPFVVSEELDGSILGNRLLADVKSQHVDGDALTLIGYDRP